MNSARLQYESIADGHFLSPSKIKHSQQVCGSFAVYSFRISLHWNVQIESEVL